MTSDAPSRADYLERLRDHLPAKEAQRVLEEVDGLIQDRKEAELEFEGVDEAEAESRALRAMGSPEELASRLMEAPLEVDLATRRSFTRSLMILFAAHLVLSIVLTVAGTSGTGIPGLLGPLDTRSLASTFGSVLAIFLIDTGVLFLLFALLGRGKTPSGLPRLQLRTVASRRDSILALVLLALVALILYPFRDQVFAVREGDQMVGFLAPGLVEALPFVGVALVLLALRQVLILVKGRESRLAILTDAVASLVLAFALVFTVTRDEIVRFPEGTLGSKGAETLENVVTRVFLLVFVAAALFLTVRAVKRLLRLRQLLG